ncbi:hypothetical protein CASFOL_030586 [Castilleja foliolosa]|uniref:Uncharacterized protein n=1 Tax=Castilleja foliolosa TaxID=1961234 RepID=A0ABD3C6D2_9LAMI
MDLAEKKQNFRRNVVSLAAELKEVRGRLSFVANETLIRQEAENKVTKMEKEVSRLEKSLEERNLQIQSSTSDRLTANGVASDIN